MMNNKPLLVLIAIILFAAAAFMALRKSIDPAGAQEYFYDLSTGSVFAALRQNPPIPSPAGGEAVKANVYSCGACDPEHWFVASIETNVMQGDQTQSRIAAPVHAGAQPHWLDPTSEAAQSMIQAALQRCGAAGNATYCLP